PTLLVANNSDLDLDPDEIEILEELVGAQYPALFVSAKTGHGLDKIGALLFQGLEVIRVYTKVPGHPAESDKPYTVFRGDTVQDVARLVHRDIAGTLKFARLWGSGKFDGQQVGRDHPLNDGDIIELHA
ncbi:MAG: TGS domain-containing protein, partial [Candidatus Krumholzibacteria bacterium]|nr:TGS domain-containing protein [Candidatus Krumholzibacteria bacterium]